MVNFLKYLRVSLLLLTLLFTTNATASMDVVYDIYGKPFTDSLVPNKWIVINYWASWCDACISEIPDLNRFAAMAKNSNVVFFAVNYDDLAADMQQSFAKRYNINYTLLRQNPLRNLVPVDAITTLPMTYVISPQGETQQLFGTQSAENLMRSIR